MRAIPTGSQAIAHDLYASGTWRVYGLVPVSYVGRLTLPQGPPALPSPRLKNVMPAGDRNGDGFEELLLRASGRDIVTGAEHILPILADGRSLDPIQPIWVRDYPPDEPGSPLLSLLLPWSQDLDGDGHGDFFSIGGPNPGLGTGRSFGALSGADGSLIWTYREPQPNGFDPTWNAYDCHDLDGDGVRDLVALNLPRVQFQDWGRLYTLSGATGSLIWENDTFGQTMPYFLQVLGLNIDTEVRDFSPIGDLDRDGKPEIGLLAKVWYYNAAPNWSTYEAIHRMWIFRGSDGALIDFEDWPPDLSPYQPEVGFDYRSIRSAQPLGDLDGDGYHEWSAVVGYDGPPYQIYLAIFGRRTLAIPNEVELGATFDLDIDIPTGGSCPFHLLLSTGLDWNGGGYALGVWDTFLVPDNLLAWSLSHPPLHGVLDSLGFGSTTLTVPNQPSLAGRTFHARAWIEDPAAPGAVRTMSSLASFVVE